MNRQIVIILSVLGLIVVLPFIFQRESAATNWKEGDPFLVIISPHNEAIRHEFAVGFSHWHEEHHGAPVKIDWRNIGGTSEIARYLESEMASSFRAWWKKDHEAWPPGALDVMTDRRFNPDQPPEGMDPETFDQLVEIRETFRSIDDAEAFSADIDLFFGGGHYDHNKAYRQGLTVPPWKDGIPEHLVATSNGIPLIPEQISGEVWRSDSLVGTAVSTFGICYNFDRLEQLGIEKTPNHWNNLTDPRFFRQLGVADPTKSGSIAKAFELIIHQACREAVYNAGFSDADIADYEARIEEMDGEVPDTVPAPYQAAIEQGWLDGIRRIQLIGANSRYFTDSASKVPIDVSMGNAAAGIAIDFYGRYQAQVSQTPAGERRMAFITPEGGSGVSCDPISLLRSAPHRDLAVKFMEYVVSVDGQKLWTYKPGTPGGPEQYSLRRIPIQRSFYPSEDPTLQASHTAHLPHAADDLSDPRIDPYAIAETFIYYPRWTGRLFGIQRDIIRVMCMDAAAELKEAWKAIIDAGGPAAQPEAMRLLARMPDTPEPLNWQTAHGVSRRYDRLEYTREWTLFFRESYREAGEAVEEAGS